MGRITREAGPIWYAGTMVHEACHSQQYNDYQATYSTSSVPKDVFSGKEAEAQCLMVQTESLKKMGASQHILDHVKTIIHSEYWKTPVTEREW